MRRAGRRAGAALDVLPEPSSGVTIPPVPVSHPSPRVALSGFEAPAVRCRGVRKRFGDIDALDGVNLRVATGTLTAVIGPSGCGKTTLLRTLAGFETPDYGEIDIGGRQVAGPCRLVPARERDIGMVFQDYALFPHMDVRGNVGYALGRRPERARVEEMLECVGLAGLGARRPHELSGGQQQRVALARALVAHPAVVLLDEPFSNLDASLRVQVRSEVRQILAAQGVSALLVTHDQEEALSMADRIVVMRDGRVVQEGDPDEVYHHPATRWVAGFLGEVESLSGSAEGDRVATPLGGVDYDGAERGAVDVLVRPEDIAMVAADVPGPDDAAEATVVERQFFGHDQLVTAALADGRRVRHRCGGGGIWRPGDRVRMWVCGPATVLPAEREPEAGAQVATPV
ncbi:MAG: ABC transporter ATP-binding protein [Thermoleophilia bacterium]|jgi:iron(III) transport system ATP-binding protein